MNAESQKRTVHDFMRAPVLIRQDAKLKDVLATFIDEQTNIACVVDESGRLLGSVTTVDIIRAVLPDYIEYDAVAARFADDSMLKEDLLRAACHPVSELMGGEETTVPEDIQLFEAAVISSKDSTGRLVVVDADKKPIGILTRTHIKLALADFMDVRNELSQCK